MIYKLTSSYSGRPVKKGARGNKTKEAERCAVVRQASELSSPPRSSEGPARFFLSCVADHERFCASNRTPNRLQHLKPQEAKVVKTKSKRACPVCGTPFTAVQNNVNCLTIKTLFHRVERRACRVRWHALG